jgi:hypothetical protein
MGHCGRNFNFSGVKKSDEPRILRVKEPQKTGAPARLKPTSPNIIGLLIQLGVLGISQEKRRK